MYFTTNSLNLKPPQGGGFSSRAPRDKLSGRVLATLYNLSSFFVGNFKKKYLFNRVKVKKYGRSDF